MGLRKVIGTSLLALCVGCTQMELGPRGTFPDRIYFDLYGSGDFHIVVKEDLIQRFPITEYDLNSGLELTTCSSAGHKLSDKEITDFERKFMEDAQNMGIKAHYNVFVPTQFLLMDDSICGVGQYFSAVKYRRMQN